MSNLVPSLTRQYLRTDQHLTYLCCRAPPEEAGGPVRFLWMYALAFLAAAMLLQVQRARPAQEEAEAAEALEFFPGPAWHALEVGEMDDKSQLYAVIASDGIWKFEARSALSSRPCNLGRAHTLWQLPH